MRNNTTSQQFVLEFVGVSLGAGAPGVAIRVCGTVGIVATPVTIGAPRITFSCRVPNW